MLGAVPTQQTVIAERFFDEGGGMQLVMHAPFGARVNKAWGLALRKRFCRSFNFELQAAATDDGLNISLAEQHSFPLADVFHYLQPETVKDVLEQAILTGQSPVFASRWRWDAQRALALLRFHHGKKVPPHIQRIRADDLLASVFPDVAACFENIEGDILIPDHPLVREVMKDVLHEAMDLDALTAVLRDIESGAIRTLAIDTPAPSPFAHEILNANPYAFLDDAPLEERRARAVEMRRVLPESVLQEVGYLDPEAIAVVCQQAWPDVRDADELHDALQTLIAVPANVSPEWRPHFDRLAATGRAGLLRTAGLQAGCPGGVYTASMPMRGPEAPATADVDVGATDTVPLAGDAPGYKRTAENERGAGEFWVAAEQAHTFSVLHPHARWLQPPAELNEDKTGSRSDAVLAIVNGWMLHSGPVTAEQLSRRLLLPTGEVEQALLRLESNGTVLRGTFHRSEPAQMGGQPATISAATEWCERRLLARIHRLTLGRLRQEIEPVTPAEYMRWLLRWQHVAPGTQLHGERGLLEVLQQLQGLEIPANAWERQVLARRVAAYDPQVLDTLCLTGAVGWGRLSPHPATLQASAKPPAEGMPRGRRVIPTSVAPITFFVREEADWMPPAHLRDTPGLSPAALQVYEFLQRNGASFFADIVRGTSRLKAEVEDRAVGTGRRRPDHGGWIRQPAGAAGPEAPLGTRLRTHGPSTALVRPLVPVASSNGCRPVGRGPDECARSNQPGLIAPLRRGFSRVIGPRVDALLA